jgi:hypothetical protein
MAAKVPLNIARQQLSQAAHRESWPAVSDKLLRRARDLDGDVTREELKKLLTTWE